MSLSAPDLSQDFIEKLQPLVDKQRAFQAATAAMQKAKKNRDQLVRHSFKPIAIGAVIGLASILGIMVGGNYLTTTPELAEPLSSALGRLLPYVPFQFTATAALSGLIHSARFYGADNKFKQARKNFSTAQKDRQKTLDQQTKLFPGVTPAQLLTLARTENTIQTVRRNISQTEQKFATIDKTWKKIFPFMNTIPMSAIMGSLLASVLLPAFTTGILALGGFLLTASVAAGFRFRYISKKAAAEPPKQIRRLFVLEKMLAKNIKLRDKIAQGLGINPYNTTDQPPATAIQAPVTTPTAAPEQKAPAPVATPQATPDKGTKHRSAVRRLAQTRRQRPAATPAR